MTESRPLDTTIVSIVVPCRNEAEYIGPFLESLFRQELHDIAIEVLIADGMSDDGTREVLAAYRADHPEVRVIDNPGRIVSTGLNAAVEAARGAVIVRMDAHTTYAPDYIYRCVQTLRETGADNVGGPWQAAGTSYLQAAIALAFQSPFSSGGAGSHALEKEGIVDSVYLGCWRKETLQVVGLFDEELVRNQDDELNLRLTRQGYKVWQSPKIKSWYYPRSSLRALFRQYSQYGYWKVRVIQKHKLPASPRHLVPGGFVGSLALSAVLAPFSGVALWAFVLLAGSYGCANLAAAVLTCRAPERIKFLPVMPLVFGAYHLGYGYGFVRGVIDFTILKRGGRSTFTKITRGKVYEQ